MTEYEKMISGSVYNPYDETLVELRKKARNLIRKFNSLDEEAEERNQIIRKLFAGTGKNFIIESPFICDYGLNIDWGEEAYANFGCVILDSAPVIIGRKVLIAPDVKILTVAHPVNPEDREKGIECAKAVRIEENVWIGAGAIINPGVTIGKNSVIGSGSVVTKDIPPDVVAVGNPCRVIRKIVNTRRL